MIYNVSKLNTVAECDQAIAIATERMNDLLFEQTVAGRELTDHEKAVALTTANLISINAQITGTQAAIAGMPDGDAKKDMVSKLRRLNDRKDNLEERLEKGGNVAVLDTELDSGLLQAQVAELNQYIAAVTARKAEL